MRWRQRTKCLLFFLCLALFSLAKARQPSTIKSGHWAEPSLRAEADAALIRTRLSASLAYAPPVPHAFARIVKTGRRASRNIQQVYYYGDQQQLSRASGTFQGLRVHAFPTHSLHSTPNPSAYESSTSNSYDQRSHNKKKLEEDPRVLAEASELALSLDRTTMKVRNFSGLDERRSTSTTAASTTTSATPPANWMEDSPRSPHTFSITASHKLRHVVPSDPQTPPPLLLGAAPSPPLPNSPSATLSPLIMPPSFASQTSFVFGVAGGPQLVPPNGQAVGNNISPEQLGCGFDIITNTCKDVFGLGWCGRCQDFGNIFVHDCKCVSRLVLPGVLLPPEGTLQS